jgi:glutaredoxin
MQPDLSFLEGHDVAVYSAPWCADCRRLERVLDASGIAYREVDIEADLTAATRLEGETGKRAIPYLLVNDRSWVRGYHKEHPARLDPRRLADELRGALVPSADRVGAPHHPAP